MAAIMAAPAPLAASYNDASRRQYSRQDLHRPSSRPGLRKGMPFASSMNDPPVQQPFSFSMNDSSDDEMPVPPMKFSAEVKSLLGDEASIIDGSSPLRKREGARGIMKLDKPIKRESPLPLSERFRERTSMSPSSFRTGSPRIVRLNASPRMSPLIAQRSTSLQNQSPEPAQPMSYVTPAPRPKSGLSVSVGSLGGVSSEGQVQSTSAGQVSAGSFSRSNPTPGSREDASLDEAEAQMGSLSISRNKADDTGPQTAQRQRRVQLTGTFLRGGRARRGMKRRQSEEDQSPNRGDEVSPVNDQNAAEEALRNGNMALPTIESQEESRHVDEGRRSEERPAQVRFQSQASIVTGSPELKKHEPIKPSMGDAFRSQATATSDSASATKRAEPIFKLPPMPLLPSRFDQENDPPPTFKRNKVSTSTLGDRGKFTIASDEKMLVQTPITASPARKPLAVRSQNTPLRPAPPPPKMSVLETATAPAGAASVSQNKKKRLLMSVNGKYFTRMDCIGRGGSSRVYRVMAENYKIFALKKVTLEDQDELAVRGYKGEIDLLRKLENVDRVVRLFDYEINEEKQTLLVLMEMGESDLNRVLTHHLGAEDATFDITTMRYYWREMLQCVSAVHALNIVHSDLKPANFLLLQGRLKLIDFGISNSIADDTVNVHREQHIGTPNYMSPEALIDSNATAGLPSTEGKKMKLGKPSDVWSLGCILYQMVYGKPPFAHIPNQMQRIMAIPNPNHVINFPELAIGGVPVPLGLMRTLKRCLNRDLTQRPTVDEMLSPNDMFLNPDAVLEKGMVPVGTELIARLQMNIVRHIREKGMPSEEDLKVWPERFLRSIRSAIEEGRA